MKKKELPPEGGSHDLDHELQIDLELEAEEQREKDEDEGSTPAYEGHSPSVAVPETGPRLAEIPTILQQ